MIHLDSIKPLRRNVDVRCLAWGWLSPEVQGAVVVVMIISIHLHELVFPTLRSSEGPSGQSTIGHQVGQL